jgi:hypothetical protein
MEFDVVNLRNTIDIALLASFAALFLPYLIALINRPTWPKEARGLITMLVYGITGVIVAWWQGSLDNATDITAAIVPIFITASMKYNFLDKPSNLAPKLEYLTSGRDFNLYSEDKLRQDPKPIVVEAPSGEQTVVKPPE